MYDSRDIIRNEKILQLRAKLSEHIGPRFLVLDHIPLRRVDKKFIFYAKKCVYNDIHVILSCLYTTVVSEELLFDSNPILFDVAMVTVPTTTLE